MSSKATQKEIDAVKRVLELVNDCIGIQDQESRQFWHVGDVTTWGELRQRIKGTLRLSVFKNNGENKNGVY